MEKKEEKRDGSLRTKGTMTRNVFGAIWFFECTGRRMTQPQHAGMRRYFLLVAHVEKDIRSTCFTFCLIGC
jgi:hypothetical protein